MEYTIEGNYLKLQGNPDHLAALHELFTFRDKAAEKALERLRKTLRARERVYTTPPEWWGGWKRKKLKEAHEKVRRRACVMNEKKGTLFVPVGLQDQLHDWANKKGIIVKTEDHRDWDAPRRLLTGLVPNLRNPQAEALEIVKNDPRGFGLIRMATGVGKTALGQEIIRHYGVPSLFLVPSRPILKQTVERFRDAFGRKNIGTFGDGKKKHSWVTVATYQSVNKADPSEFADYKLAIFDEVHHIAAETFFEVGLNRIPNLLYRYGLTADEERADGGTILVHAAAGPVIYSYDAAQAIKDGYLARPTFAIYYVNNTRGSYIEWGTDYKTKKRKNLGVKVSEEYDGQDYLKSYKNWVLGNDLLTQKIAEMAQAFNEDGKSVLVLINEKEHGDKFKELLPDAGFVYGGLTSNDNYIDQFNARKLKTIVATSTLGEGADTVPVDVLINLMGGRFPKQANGRALRNDPDENGVPRKPETLIIDFDFPLCHLLSRHSKERQKVHKEYVGEIHSHSILI